MCLYKKSSHQPENRIQRLAILTCIFHWVLMIYLLLHQCAHGALTISKTVGLHKRQISISILCIPYILCLESLLIYIYYDLDSTQTLHPFQRILWWPLIFFEPHHTSFPTYQETFLSVSFCSHTSLWSSAQLSTVMPTAGLLTAHLCTSCLKGSLCVFHSHSSITQSVISHRSRRPADLKYVYMLHWLIKKMKKKLDQKNA